MRTNLEILLGDWGHWKALQDDAGLGYPSEAAFSKMRVDCNVYQGAAVSMVDPDLHRLESAIGRLHPQYRAVVTIHYKMQAPVKVKHDALGIARRTYYDYLDFCHKQLAHEMGGIYATGHETKLSALVE